MTECTYDADTATLTIVAADDVGVLASQAGGGAITVTGADCSPATVANTDAIEVTVLDGFSVTLDMSAGPFAPGATDEGDGTSEIEFQMHLVSNAALSVIGTDGADVFATGAETSVGDVVSLNGDDDRDVEIASGDDSRLLLLGMGGNDRIDLTGGADAPIALPTVVSGGTGNDVVRFRGSGSAVEIGGDDGIDVLMLTDAPTQSSVVVDLDSGDGLVNGLTSFVVEGIEVVIGHEGEDYLFGTDGRQELSGRSGPDVMLGLAGNDHLDSGPGPDFLRGGAGLDACIGNARDEIRSCEVTPSSLRRTSGVR